MTILTLKIGRGAKSLIQCDNCGATYDRLTSRIKDSKHHFCNMKCKSQVGWIDGRVESEYHKQKQREFKDAKNKKKDKAKKRCINCGRIYWGPRGNFPKNRDPNIPEPGLCGCTKSTEEDYGGGVVDVRSIPKPDRQYHCFDYARGRDREES